MLPDLNIGDIIKANRIFKRSGLWAHKPCETQIPGLVLLLREMSKHQRGVPQTWINAGITSLLNINRYKCQSYFSNISTIQWTLHMWFGGTFCKKRLKNQIGINIMDVFILQWDKYWWYGLVFAFWLFRFFQSHKKLRPTGVLWYFIVEKMLKK